MREISISSADPTLHVHVSDRVDVPVKSVRDVPAKSVLEMSPSRNLHCTHFMTHFDDDWNQAFKWLKRGI